MSEYTLTDAMIDPSRPLNMSPDRWVAQVKQRRGSVNTETVKTVVATDSNKVPSNEEEVARIDSAVDSIISGIREAYEALISLKKTELNARERAIFVKVTDLLDTAVSPYVADIVKELDKLEEE